MLYRLGEKELLLLIKAGMLKHGLEPRTIEVVNNRLTGLKQVNITYTSRADSVNKAAWEIGTIIGCFVGVKQQGLDADEVVVEFYNAQGQPAGVFYVKKPWIDAYMRGEISMEELGSKTASTVATLKKK